MTLSRPWPEGVGTMERETVRGVGGRLRAGPLLAALLVVPLSLLPGLLGSAGIFYLVVAAAAGCLHLAAIEGDVDRIRGGRSPALWGGLLALLAAAFLLDRIWIGSEPPNARSLPLLNASLNGTAALALVTGLLLIRRGHLRAHRRAMLVAALVSACFLASYVAYHLQVGSVPYEGPAAAAGLYYTVLVSHMALAPLLLPLAGAALLYGITDRRTSHRRVVRWTLPVWLYVSVTGLLIYVVLHG